ncbi:MAG: hypothetical protein GY851_34570 [bacterium]|nr:hypothetical protein [bacterium]
MKRFLKRTQGTDRIRELETHVSRLESQVHTLQTKLATHDRHAADADHFALIPHHPWLWINRIVVVLMTFELGLATWLSLAAAGVDLSAATRLSKDLIDLDLNVELIACAVAVVAAVLLFLTRRRDSFLAFALVGMYLPYWLYFAVRPVALPLTDRAYDWLSTGWLGLFFLLVSGACIHESRRTGRRGRTAALIALANSAVFLLLVRGTFQSRYPGLEWLFLMGFSGVQAVLALFAETSGPRRNYLFQVFVGMTIAAFTLGLSVVLEGEWLWAALALECLALGFTYERTGIVLLKVANLALLAATLYLCIKGVKVMDTAVIAADYAIPAVWLFGVTLPILFIATAWFYEHHVDRVLPHKRRLSGHWFLADTFLDVPCATAAMFHAAAAAFVPIVFTVVNLEDQTQLPYLLTVLGAAALVLGFLIRTPQVEASAMLIMVAAHVSYFFLQGQSPPPVQIDAETLIRPGVLVAFTFLAGVRWERYLRRIPAQSAWEHDTIAGIPHILATALLASIAGRALDGPTAALAQNMLGLLVIMAGMAFRYTPLAIGGAAGLVYGTVTLVVHLQGADGATLSSPEAVVLLASALVTYIVAERLLALARRRADLPSPACDTARTIVVMATAGVAMLAFARWVPPDYRPLCWLAVAAAGAVAGAMLSDALYRWVGFLVLVVSMLVVCLPYLRQETSDVSAQVMFRNLAGGVIVLVLMILSWSHSAYHRRVQARSAASAAKDSGSDG